MNRDFVREMSRRTFLGRGAAGLGMVALNSLLNPRLSPQARRRARRRGASSTRCTFRRRPSASSICTRPAGRRTWRRSTTSRSWRRCTASRCRSRSPRASSSRSSRASSSICFGPQHGFKKFGKSGQEICELFPHIGGIADDICIVRSMWTEQINHDPAHTFMNTGSIIAGRPSMGSWVLYGLGAETENLPGFVVLRLAGKGGQMQPIAARQWSAGFCRAGSRACSFNSIGDPVLYISNPARRQRRDAAAIRSTRSTR